MHCQLKDSKLSDAMSRDDKIVDRMALDTCRLHDSNGKGLSVFIHGNRLIKAIINVEELKRIWSIRNRLRRF